MQNNGAFPPPYNVTSRQVFLRYYTVLCLCVFCFFFRLHWIVKLIHRVDSLQLIGSRLRKTTPTVLFPQNFTVLDLNVHYSTWEVCVLY